MALIFGLAVSSLPQLAVAKGGGEVIDSNQSRGGSSGREDGSSRDSGVWDDGIDSRGGSDEVKARLDSSDPHEAVYRERGRQAGGHARVVISEDDRL